MELRQIEYFIEVAKREHMTEAALALHVAQSAVSRQIYNLEEELGVPLFYREGRKIKLTPVGNTFLTHMQKALDMIERAKREMAESMDPEKGTIRIGFPSSLASYILPKVISDFREVYPEAKFTLKQGSYRYLIDSVIKGHINMALIGPLPLNEKKIHGETLFIERLVALLSTSHPLAKKKTLQLHNLQGDPFILYPKGYVLREIVMKACKAHGFDPEVAFEGKDTDAIKGLVAAGLGVTLIPEISLIDSLPRFTVKLPLEDPSVTRAVGVIIPAERELMPTEKLFYEFLKETFAKLEGFQ